MPADDAAPVTRSSRARLRRSGRHLVRFGGLLAVVSLVVTLIGGWATRSLLDHLQSNSAELLDGTATVSLVEGTERTLYVTGGLIAPGEIVPTPVEQITCTITGPGGELPFTTLAEEGSRVGIDTALARFQVVGHFRAEQAGEHLIDCEGRGVVVAPEVSPASALLRLGGLALGSLGTFVGLSMLLIGGVLLLLVRPPEDGAEEVVEDAPPEEGADEWWEDEAGEDRPADGDAAVPSGEVMDDAGAPGEDYVDLTDEEFAALSEEEIAELVASGQLVLVDDDEGAVGGADESGSSRP
ncbi:hypothetical protein BJF86_06655 [Serinicoccus sp. CNJ-927]|uniref:hypothetical protein n=1 Tax=Serinicoccus sp. CNJ-927 TaxID=1904970 RepID=UPI0009598CC1|nr:hypothetical protein [Serinicoccus sp. CNJ-927]OLT39912.1 hypothetical protein BJF86_06655 [Serinicoccus sp. CNJ-927]